MAAQSLLGNPITSKSQGDFHGSAQRSREVAGLVLREIVHEAGVKIPRHAHEHAHLAFVLRGNFTETCERKVLECKPLSVSFLAPGLTHSDYFPNGVQCLVIEIMPQWQERVAEYLALDAPGFFYGGLSAWLMMRLYDEARQSDEASSLAIEGLALETLAEVSRQQSTISGRIPPRWLERAREFLHAQFPRSSTHQEIARLVGVHPAHLATVFRRHYGCTIGEYVRRLRVESACRKMSTSDAPLIDIALAAGFSDQSHFSKVFKQSTGMTPAQFCANLRKP